MVANPRPAAADAEPATRNPQGCTSDKAQDGAGARAAVGATSDVRPEPLTGFPTLNKDEGTATRRHLLDWLVAPPGCRAGGASTRTCHFGRAFNRQFHVCTALAITATIKPSQIAVRLPKHITGEECHILLLADHDDLRNRLEEYVCTLDDVWMKHVESALHVVWRLT
jgi:mRNA-degrading endonuclease toxin of MazEF toxin-antitoxin module